jgi:hypothetical protein
MHGRKALRGLHHHNESNRFGKLFPRLPALETDRNLLAKLGDDTPTGGSGVMVEAHPANADAATRSGTIPIGHVFLGQFIDHDITLDLTSSLDVKTDPAATENFRTPALDLDCVYGDGPEGSPYLYVEADGPFRHVKLYVPEDGLDLARAPNTRALIGDPRNDENRVISQIQLAFVKFHNAVAEHIHAGEGLTGGALFEKTREEVQLHYQWILLYEFLPIMIGKDLTASIVTEGPKVYPTDGKPFIPVEFSVAAYRFGHSIVTNEIIFRDPNAPQPLFRVGAFEPVGGRPEDTVDLQYYFEDTIGNGVKHLGPARPARQLDTKLAPELFALPFADMGAEGLPGNRASLATRNLLRGQSLGLPSGQAVAKTIDAIVSGIPVLGPADFPELTGDLAPLASATPLWYYILQEAAIHGKKTRSDGDITDGGEQLGPVGGRIVGETLIGLLKTDPTSLLSEGHRDWRPSLGRTPGKFEMIDLLLKAGVVSY